MRTGAELRILCYLIVKKKAVRCVAESFLVTSCEFPARDCCPSLQVVKMGIVATLKRNPVGAVIVSVFDWYRKP